MRRDYPSATTGSLGGTINLVSKIPQARDLTILQGSVGTDEYYRGAIDSNWRRSSSTRWVSTRTVRSREARRSKGRRA